MRKVETGEKYRKERGEEWRVQGKIEKWEDMGEREGGGRGKDVRVQERRKVMYNVHVGGKKGKEEGRWMMKGRHLVGREKR